MFSDPFLAFVHETLTGIILIGQYRKALVSVARHKFPQYSTHSDTINFLVLVEEKEIYIIH